MNLRLLKKARGRICGQKCIIKALKHDRNEVFLKIDNLEVMKKCSEACA